MRAVIQLCARVDVFLMGKLSTSRSALAHNLKGVLSVGFTPATGLLVAPWPEGTGIDDSCQCMSVYGPHTIFLIHLIQPYVLAVRVVSVSPRTCLTWQVNGCNALLWFSFQIQVDHVSPRACRTCWIDGFNTLLGEALLHKA